MPPETSPADIIYTVADVAKRYQVSRCWVTDHATGRHQPVLEGMKIGKSWRFTASQLEDFERRCQSIASDIAKRKTRRCA